MPKYSDEQQLADTLENDEREAFEEVFVRFITNLEVK